MKLQLIPNTITVIGMGKPWYGPFSIFTNIIEDQMMETIINASKMIL